ncbi:ER membrane protein complex subunit 2-like protein [Dinothrombium tinctorium]|uniref:ER membrane protein complex subunit 2 n=1 Tax=Dinothrombium tinctorium TaxID=1965070 RepID=A0A3S3PDP1_9ACAR|nr:ER membrane protein complex subunit 2-like protein [Dinothrombium tinctorium]RWS10589.1 ER membrane protein complex subunit 2-like protein [Dinothrombium tinctorium]
MTTKSSEEWKAPLTKQEARSLLQKWREENTRCPEKVRDVWQAFDLRNSVGDEKWQILEQVCLAAMDLHDAVLIKDCLTQLDAKFPNSSRVRRLKVMAKLELRERYEDALKVYDDMIKKDESNSILYKRKIAILIAQRKIPEAIREMSEYLKKFMNDSEAWLELCDLYIQEQEYSKAAFCMEELILTNPHNHLYHQKYAEIQYTINTQESMELARSYYSQAVKLNPTNMRALYGLFLTASNLSQQAKYTSQKRRENAKIASWAMSHITKIYEDAEAGKHQLSALEAMMGSLQVNSVN